MKARQTLRQAIAVLSFGVGIISAATPMATAPASNSAEGATILAHLVQGTFAPAPAMAQTLVEGRGKIIAVTQEKQELVLEHGEIKGFMDAMTMGYKVSSPALLKGLKAGDQVQFTIDKQKSVIIKVSKVKN